MREDAVTWEAVHADGSSLVEAGGGLYKDIDRKELVVFSLKEGETTLYDLQMSFQFRGYDFVYRRRTRMIQSAPEGRGRQVEFVMGWVDGPISIVRIGDEAVHVEGIRWVDDLVQLLPEELATIRRTIHQPAAELVGKIKQAKALTLPDRDRRNVG